MNRDDFEKTLGFIYLLTFFNLVIEEKTVIDFKSPETRNTLLSLNSTFNPTKISYSEVLEAIELGWTKQVDFYDNNRTALVQIEYPEVSDESEASSQLESREVDLPIDTSQLIEALKDHNVNFDAHSTPSIDLFFIYFMNILFPLLCLSSIVDILQDDDEELDDFFDESFDDFLGDFFDDFFGSFFDDFFGDFPGDLGKSLAKFEPFPDTGVFFNDIAGIDEAKAEFEEIVSFLKEPERYTRVGARIPKGVLVVGPPGTGKTLLAKAIANEANVPFFSVAGSEFVEMFIGVGAARVRDLFTKAAENAPCIVFIDEIDAVGRERGSGIGGGNDEREQTLNQLLTEMDGFRENKGVIVIGATNRADILDPALVRAGRFDRQITIGLPDRLGRIEILKVHAKNKNFKNDVSLVKIANRTPGSSGADLANILNEAAILSTRYKKEIITNDEVDEAIDRSISGIPSEPMENTKDKKLIAYHEVGHALTGSLLKYHDPVERITLIPRGGAKGLTWFISNEDQGLISRAQLMAQIATILSGRVCEKLVFGNTDITTGATNDLQEATNIARQMVTRYGMSSIGPISLEEDEYGPPSPNLTNRIDSEISQILNYCERLATQIISKNRVLIDFIVEKLLMCETLEGEEFRDLIRQYTKIPATLNDL